MAPTRRRSTHLLLTLAVAPFVLASCTHPSSSTAPASSGMTVTAGSVASEAPWGLDTVALPATEAEVRALLEAMPTELDGLTKAPITGGEAAYGDTGMGPMAGSMETFLRVMDLGGAPGNDYGTGAPFVQALVESGDIGDEGSALGDAGLVWAAGHAAGSKDYYTVMWAEPDSRYVFLVQGTSGAQRLALIDAFKRATGSA